MIEELLFQFGLWFISPLTTTGSGCAPPCLFKLVLPLQRYNDGAAIPNRMDWNGPLEGVYKARAHRIVENYAQIVEEVDRNGRKRKTVFPRYHQLDVVVLLADAGQRSRRKY